MADTPPPPADDAPDPDPGEAELVAYLDGELDPAAARRVEAKLAADPNLRARADALRRSFGLLDFLPKPEPSPTFATRTIDKLPAVKSAPAAPTVAPPAVPSGSVPVPVGGASGTGSLALSAVTPPPPGWGWAAGLAAVVALALGVGYLGTAAARTYLFPLPAVTEAGADNLPVTDLRLIDFLPLYAAADDIEFVEKLAAPDQFGDEVVSPPGPAVEFDKPDGPERDLLLKAFRDMPPDRQEKLRQLDQKVHALAAPQRDRLLRVLEVYAAWLQRLPDAERKKVLAAPGPDERLAAIDDARRTQWVAALPAADRQKLKAMPPAERGETIAKWKAADDAARDTWTTARFHWEVLRTGRQPWPFGDDAMRKQVLDFARAAYRPDDPKRTRLSPPDQIRYREAVERGEKGGQWVWLGKVVYDFTRGSRYEMLPEPGANGKSATDFGDIVPGAFHDLVKKRMANKTGSDLQGKWPDFALAVHTLQKDAPKLKLVVKDRDFHLGPARPGEFRPELEQFLPVLQKKASPTEWAALVDKEGRWPEYPRELIRLARQHDLSVPGAMPPGPPSEWDKTYSPPRPALRPGAE